MEITISQWDCTAHIQSLVTKQNDTQRHTIVHIKAHTEQTHTNTQTHRHTDTHTHTHTHSVTLAINNSADLNYLLKCLLDVHQNKHKQADTQY